MLRNEGGFGFLEGIFSFSLILLLASSMFPFMFKILGNLNEGKKEMIAYRLLYEHVEMHIPSGEINRDERMVRNVHYELSLERNSRGMWEACVFYEEKEKCMD